MEIRAALEFAEWLVQGWFNIDTNLLQNMIHQISTLKMISSVGLHLV